MTRFRGPRCCARLALVSLCFVGLSACGPEPRQATWVFTFDRDGEKDATKAIRAQIWEGTCDDEAARSLVFEHWFDAGSGASPGTLAKGTYAFEGVALDGNCEPVARGCTVATVPLRESSAVTVRLKKPGRSERDALCEPDVCDNGICANGDPAARDITTDAGSSDER